ncbi:TdeIII family type II restriction endonuclease, partial [candidate division NPL-UPA2 bacterium]|nr:TdeIII family type II restriction endonuclease [candidate division NPL-UPA2 bacterium]
KGPKMGLSNTQREQISSLLKQKIRGKLQDYSPETQSMPFHFRLLGKDRMALYSFIHSVNTMLGQSIFEKVGEIIALPNFEKTFSQYKFEGYISDEAILEIDKIMQGLKAARRPSGESEENQRIKSVAKLGNLGRIRKSRADLFAYKSGEEYYFEVRTVKPNIDVFTRTKEKLLQWKAVRYSISEDIRVNSYICIPYNPEAPSPYSRWTLQGLYDLGKEVLVAEEFWDFLGGTGTWEELLDIFEQTGIELRDEIDKKFTEFRKNE